MGAASAPPANLTQESLFNNDDSNDVFNNDTDNDVFNHDTDVDMEDFCSTYQFPSPTKDSLSTVKPDLYAALHPLLKELCGVADLHTDAKKLNHYTTFFTSLIAKEKAEAFGNKGPKGRIVSSAVPTNKRHKTHGVAHYK